MKSRRLVIFSLLMVLVLGLSACAAPPPGADKAAADVVQYAESTNRFALKLPPIYVQYDNDGVLGMAGVTTNQLYQWTGIDLRGLNVQPWVVQRFVEANVQHMEVVEGTDGLGIYVNGKPLPYVAWDGESLTNLGKLLPALGVPYGNIVGKLLPLLRYTRLAVVVQFPVKPDATLAPFRAPNAPAVTRVKAEPVEEPVAVVRLDVAYDANGLPSVLGLDAATLQALGVDVQPFALDPALIQSLMQANVQHVHFVNRPDGIHIYVNNEPLPYVAWDDEHVQTALDLYATFSGLQNSPILRLLAQVLPRVRESDIDVVLRFPVPEGAEEIPVLEPAQ
ncbi:MAG: hypothetical protein GXO55_07080 [Chloroflexi bacterium]|nr:hypothetical protein [Chloroflexota bacterium]